MISILVAIFLIQIVYVTFFTLRMILTLKGQKYYAAALSSLEVIIYVLGLNLVLEYLNEWSSLAVYAIGYGIGVLAGSWIEEKIALGYVTLKVITNDADGAMARRLREQGFGVTSWIGQGKDGNRLVMEILAKRKNEQLLFDKIMQIDPKAFVIMIEPKQMHGGFWTKAIRK